MTVESTFTPAQERILSTVALGGTAIAAMHDARVDRDTIAAWLRDKQFCDALEEARIQKQLLFRDQAESLAGEALARLRVLMSDPEASRNVNLRATLAVLESALRFLQPESSALIVPDPSPAAAVTPKSVPPAVETIVPRRPAPPPARVVKIGRNQPCPCGSGKKYKYCCLNAIALKQEGPLPFAAEG